MSTQHVEGLAAGEGRLNVLTNDKGRVVDLVHHLDRGAELLLVGHRAEPGALADWLDGFLFTEDAELEPVEVRARLLAGADAPALLGLEGPAPWGFVEGEGGLLIRDFDRVLEGEPVPVWLWTGGEVEGAQLLDEGAWEAGRIAAGAPGPGELCDRFNPLELALHDAIHWAKGCYIGQEVIARIDNYGKQARHLVGLRGPCAVGDEVLLEGKKIGEVTSAVAPRQDDLPNALAVVKLRGELEGVSVVVGGAEARTTGRMAAQVPHD